MQNAIEVKNLKVVFPDRGRMIRAVEGVNLTVKKGECLYCTCIRGQHSYGISKNKRGYS